MNGHGLVDIGTIRLGALLVRDATFFARSLDSKSVVAVTDAAEADVKDLSSAGRHDVVVDTPLGPFEAAYLPWQWLGPEYPTLIYHHGSGERPFDFGRFSSNSFRRLFAGSNAEIAANVVAVRAPFHERSSMEYARAMGDLQNFVGMLAASTRLIDALVARASDRTDAPVVASGISLGGWACNLHRACFDTADHYVPLFAGAALDDLFVSSAYRHLTAASARNRPETLRETLNFEAEFSAVDTENCTPLLARYDRIIEFERQRSCYAGLPLSVLNRGHVTGSLATEALRTHVVEQL